jgi:hypothetical protein
MPPNAATAILLIPDDEEDRRHADAERVLGQRGPSATFPPEKQMSQTQDPTFYRTPADAIAAPQERLAYVAAFDPAG